MTPIIRSARPDDYPTIASIHNAQNELGFHATPGRLRASDERSAGHDPAFRRYVVEKAGAVVATGDLRSSWAGKSQPGDPDRDPRRPHLARHKIVRLVPNHSGAVIAGATVCHKPRKVNVTMLRRTMLGIAIGLLAIGVPSTSRVAHAGASTFVAARGGALDADALPLPRSRLPTELDASFLRLVEVPQREYSAWTIEVPQSGMIQMFEVHGRSTLTATKSVNDAQHTASR